MQIKDIIQVLENKAPLSLQENYDNAGLLTGHSTWECTGVLCSLDVTEDVVMETKNKGCNLIVAHHPIIFGGLQKLNGDHYVERTVIAAIKFDIAIYAIHTNLDNILSGVNNRIADQIGLINREILVPKPGQLMKLFTFVPVIEAENVRKALFAAGAGQIGEYSATSFNVEGIGTFTGNDNTHPYVGESEKEHHEKEIKIEVIFPFFLKKALIEALILAHPYEEVAYDIIKLDNDYQSVGTGLLGELPEEMDEIGFLHMVKTSFELSVIRHTPFLGKRLKKVAICGGAGSSFIKNAIHSGADIYLTADIKYHEFFDANNRLVIADIGHWESEQFTTDLLIDILQAKFPTFAVLKSVVKTNPVNYFLG